MKIDKTIGIRLTQEMHDYFKKLSEENQTTVSHEIRQVLLNVIKDKLKK